MVIFLGKRQADRDVLYRCHIKVWPATSEIGITLTILLSLYQVRDCHERWIDGLIDMQKKIRSLPSLDWLPGEIWTESTVIRRAAASLDRM